VAENDELNKRLAALRQSWSTFHERVNF
jgi:hypothetical protein